MIPAIPSYTYLCYRIRYTYIRLPMLPLLPTLLLTVPHTTKATPPTLPTRLTANPTSYVLSVEYAEQGNIFSISILAVFSVCY